MSLTHLEDSKRKELQHLLSQFPALFCQRPGRTELTHHTIHLSTPSSSRQRPYRVPERLVEPLKEEIKMMKELGVIEPSMSEWSSPMVIVPKKDGSLHVCIDFRKLNAQSKFDAYPMPRVDDLLEKIGRAQYITTLDLCKGYWQVPLNPQPWVQTLHRIPNTSRTIPIHGPSFWPSRGTSHIPEADGPSTPRMWRLVGGVPGWRGNPQQLLGRASSTSPANPEEDRGSRIDIEHFKGWVGKARGELSGVSPGQRTAETTGGQGGSNSKEPPTKDKKEVRSFLGLVGWYRRFVPNFASIAAPLTNLLSKMVTNPIPWTDDCETAFNSLKEKMCSSPVLQSPDFSQRFLVQVDASATGIGAVLAQGSAGEERPVVYLSRKLLPRETRYSAVEKEGLAIKWSLDSLRYYLLGREFDLETDHRALTWIQSMKDQTKKTDKGPDKDKEGNIVAAKPNKQAAADYDITGLVAPRRATGSWRNHCLVWIGVIECI